MSTTRSTHADSGARRVLSLVLLGMVLLLTGGAARAQSDAADDPAVDGLARLGAEGLARGEGVDPAAIEPVYLRPPDAKKPGERRSG